MLQPQSGSKTREKALIALGGNMTSTHGRPEDTVRRALDVLSGPDIDVAAVSRFYRTPCFPPGAGPDFVNAAAVLVTSLTPDALLERLHAVEAALGRARKERWGARVVDLDLLAMGGRVMPDAPTLRRWIDLPLEAQTRETPDCLLLPHPRLQDRAFVLVPLADVAAGRLKIALTRSRTGLNWSCSPHIVRAKFRLARRSLWIATMTRTPLCRCVKLPMRPRRLTICASG